VRTGREVCVILHDIEVVGSLLAWRARDSNTLWHLTAVIVHGQGVVVGVYEQVVWPQCVKTRCEGRRVGDTGCLSAGGGEVNVWVVTRNAVQRYKSHGHRDSRGTQCSVTSHTGTGTHNGAGHLLDGGGARGCPLPVKNQGWD